MDERPEIRVAVSKADLLAIYKFRYDIYVSEMGRTQHYADHDKRMISDPLDSTSRNIAAWQGHRVVACIRLTWMAADPIPYLDYYSRLYRLDLFPSNNPVETSIVTRLMIATDHRRTNLAFRLFSECYTIGLNRGTAMAFMDCNDHLVAFFKGIGYRDYIGKTTHEEYGEITPMYLDLRDIGYLRSLKSPYVKAYDQWMADRPKTKAVDGAPLPDLLVDDRRVLIGSS